MNVTTKTATDQLFEILDRIGAVPTLYGKPVTVRELKTFAWAGFPRPLHAEELVDRFAALVVTAALRASVLPKEEPWSPYP